MADEMRLDETVQSRLSHWLDRDITVLEAGCGPRSAIDFGDRAFVVGLDIDADAVKAQPQAR